MRKRGNRFVFGYDFSGNVSDHFTLSGVLSACAELEILYLGDTHVRETVQKFVPDRNY